MAKRLESQMYLPVATLTGEQHFFFVDVVEPGTTADRITIFVNESAEGFEMNVHRDDLITKAERKQIGVDSKNPSDPRVAPATQLAWANAVKTGADR